MVSDVLEVGILKGRKVVSGCPWHQKLRVSQPCAHCWGTVCENHEWFALVGPADASSTIPVPFIEVTTATYRNYIAYFDEGWFKGNGVGIAKRKGFRRSFPFNQKVWIRSISFTVNVECVFCFSKSLESPSGKISAQMSLYDTIVAHQIIFQRCSEHRNVFDRWA